MKLKRLLTILFAIFAISLTSVFAISCVATGETSSSEKESIEEPAVDNEADVIFDVNTDLETNVIRPRSIVIGRRVSEPKAFITGDNPTNLNVYGWYTSKECTEDTRWDFKTGRVAGDMTLYAKWVELYDVNYVINGELDSTINVFNGDFVEETADIVMGYKYLGSFADADHQIPFDFSAPITGETNIYIGRSEGLYLSDYEEEGLLSAGNLTDYLTAACGSYSPENGDEEGWVEPYVIESTGEKCTYVNFGINTLYGDGYVELSLMLDITQSQTIRITYKNIGKGAKISCYFTAMLDKSTYSETGMNYNSNFNYPGSVTGGQIEIPTQMSEDDEWQVVDLDLYKVMKNGYSIWGTSTFLGAIRIEVNYKGQPGDWSNEMLIKSIEGIPQEIIVEDSEEAQEILDAAMTTTEEEIIQAGASLAEKDNGIDFVKDYKSLGAIKGNAEVYPTTEGMLMYAENEVLARENGNATKGFVMNLPEGREISFETLTTLNITLKNYGYQKTLNVYVYNDEGTPIRTTMDIGSQMPDFNTYSLNLYGLFGVEEERSFTKIEFVYTSLGVDNIIVFKDVTFTDFKPFDTVGINFNDKFCYGIESTEGVDVEYNSKDKGVDFDVKTSGAVVSSSEKSYYATNEGYEFITLKGKLPTDSNITSVTAQLLICKEKNLESPESEVKEYGSPYVFAIEKAGTIEVTLPLVKEEAGFVKGIKLSFEGTGLITIKEIAYSVNETSLPFYKSYNTTYNSIQPDWKAEGNFYEYNSNNHTSIFTRGHVRDYIGGSIYIGFSANNKLFGVPHTTKNVYVPTNAKRVVVTLVYQNRTSVDDMGLNIWFDATEVAPGDGGIYHDYPWTNPSTPIDCEMGEYEWSAVSVVLEGDELEQYLGSYLAKVNFTFHGDQLSIRAITINVEV